MRSSKTIFVLVVTVLAVIVAGAAQAKPERTGLRADGDAFATVTLGAAQLDFDVTAAYERAVVTVSGRGLERNAQRFKAGESLSMRLVDKEGSPLADGMYRYTLRIHPRPEQGSGFKTAVFYIEDGATVSREAKRSELAGVRAELNRDRWKKRPERSKQERTEQRERNKQARPGRQANQRPPASERPDIPTANNNFQYGLAIYDYYPYNPYIYFYQYGNGYYYYAGGISTYGYYSPYYPYYMSNSLSTYGQHWNNVYAGYGTWLHAPYNITYGYQNYSIGGYRNYRRAPFNIDYATYASYTLATYGHYQGAFYGNNVLRAYGLFYDGYPLQPYIQPFAFLYSYAYDLYTYSPLVNYMAVGPVGVGVNTLYPTADFEIYDYNSYAAMRLNNYVATWAFSATPYGVFTVNKIGSGGQEFTINDRLDLYGPTMDVQGSVRGTQFISTSSREAKTDFQTLDGKEVLANLAELPVMSWRFKTEDGSVQHFGPVAEDFQAAFRLGDGKTITNIDADGVALAAIQGLHELLEERVSSLHEQQQADLAKRDREIAELRETVARLEEALLEQRADRPKP